MDVLAFIDPRTSDSIYNNLKKTGFKPIKIPLCKTVDDPISGHPDIQMFIYEDEIFMHHNMDLNFIKKINKYCNITICNSILSKYPKDIALNIACTGKYAIHRTNFTDPTVMNFLKRLDITMINTKQGYSKCSTLIVDKESIVTSDMSIHKSAKKHSIDSLLIKEGYIDLKGYNHGFIGGASGKFENTLFITGTIDHHPDREKIYNFIETKGLKIKILSKVRAVDIGSILFYKT